MKEILCNLALIDANKFCEANGINYSGSHLIKHTRGYNYDLVWSDTKKPIVTVQFHKRQVPTHIIHR